MREQFLSRTWIYQAALTALGFALLANPTVAQEQATTPTQSGWKVIAKKSIRFCGLIQRIDLKQLGQPVRGLKIRTRGRRMTFSSIKVRFRNGRIHNERRRIRLKSGEASGAIATVAKARIVDEVILIPDVSAPRRRAIGVEILALLGPDNSPKNENASKSIEATAAAENGGVIERDSKSQRGNVESSVTEQKTNQSVQATSANNTRQDQKTRSLTSTALNRLSAASTEVDLPSAKPKPQIKSQAPKPKTVQLGSPTQGGELLLGQKTISQDNNIAVFDLAGKPSRLSRVRLHLTGNNVRIKQLVVFFKDDTQRQEAFDVVQRRNTMSRWVELDTKKSIARLELHSDETGSQPNRASVELLGEPVLASQLPDFERTEASEAWFLIAAQSGRMIRSFDGHFPVAPNRGGFAKLKLVRIGRSPLPRKMIVRTNSTHVPKISLSAAQSSGDFFDI